MSQFIFANNVLTTLAAPITSTTQNTLTLSSTANAPTLSAGQVWPLTLNDAATGSVFEVVYVTARTGAVCNISRGQEGTAPQTWLAGDDVYGSVTAAALNGFVRLDPGVQQPGAVSVSGVTSGSYTVTTGGTASAGSVYLGNDGSTINGMLLNIPTNSTNGLRLLINGSTVLLQVHKEGDLAIQPTINGTQSPGNVPPVYNSGGGNVGATVHVVQDTVVASGTTTTITLTGAAVFANLAYIAVAFESAQVPVAVNILSTSSFSFPSTSGHSYNYFAIGP